MTNDLRTLLDELVVDARARDDDWSDVVARSHRLKKPRLREAHARYPRARRAAFVLAVLAALAIAGAAVGIGVDLRQQQEEFHAQLPDDPRRLGPLVELTSGDEWALLAWNSDIGICVDFAVPGNSPFECDFPVRGAKAATDTSGSGLPTHAVAGMLVGGNLKGGDGKATIFGVAAKEVAGVTVELRNGRKVRATVLPPPAELHADVRFFIARLDLGDLEHDSRNPVQAYIAYDTGGQVIERFAD